MNLVSYILSFKSRWLNHQEARAYLRFSRSFNQSAKALRKQQVSSRLAQRRRKQQAGVVQRRLRKSSRGLPESSRKLPEKRLGSGRAPGGFRGAFPRPFSELFAASFERFQAPFQEVSNPRFGGFKTSLEKLLRSFPGTLEKNF